MGTIDPFGHYHPAPGEQQITPDQEIDLAATHNPRGPTKVR